MIRRTFLMMLVEVATSTVSVEIGMARRHFAFKIKTKEGGIIGNVVIEANDVEGAKTKLMKRHPGCTILSVTEK